MSVPYVIEKGKGGQEKVYDLYSRLLKDRIVFIKSEFTSDMANAVVAQLLFLETSDPESDIYMYINSPGGEINSMYAIYDVMNYIKPDVVTVGVGQCSSAASFILASGTKGKRYALPNSEIMLHELSSGVAGKAQDMFQTIERTKRLWEKMAVQYSEVTGQKLEKIKEDMSRDFYMTAEEAKDYGIIDEVYSKRD
jgi:ATP-dependent Clp protease protease subunit